MSLGRRRREKALRGWGTRVGPKDGHVAGERRLCKVEYWRTKGKRSMRSKNFDG